MGQGTGREGLIDYNWLLDSYVFCQYDEHLILIWGTF